MWSPKTNYPICLIGLILTLLFLPKIASAQTVTGTLRGTVSDSKGAVVPGADVVIRNMETGQERTIKTGGEGVYVAPRLGRLRVSPHVYNDEADADRFIEALTRRLRG